MNQRKLIIGIKPSFNLFGTAIYNPENKSFVLKTGTMIDQVKWIQTQVKLKECVAIVENPALNYNYLESWPIMKTEIEAMMKYQVNKSKKIIRQVTISEIQSSFLVAMELVMCATESKLAAKQIITHLSNANIPVLEVEPIETNKKDFLYHTGYKGSSNEQNRIAAMLCINQTVSGVLASIEMSVGKFKKQPSRPKTSNDNWFIMSAKV